MRLTKNFRRSEFDSRDGIKVPFRYYSNLKRLANNLQVLRDELGVPIIVLSGYRSPSHNDAVGGADVSRHLTAEAGDIITKYHSAEEIASTIERLIQEGKMSQGGLGRYKNFIHYDVGRNGRKVRWGRT